ncbi:MAG: GFA family protein [Acidiferrobacterales bacterium]
MEYETANCHCSMCRRTSGAPFVSWFVVPTSEFRWVSGKPKELQSSDHGIRSFCSDCGTPLTCELDTHPQVIDVTICSLDDPEQLPPKTDEYTDTQLSWVSLSHE